MYHSCSDFPIPYPETTGNEDMLLHFEKIKQFSLEQKFTNSLLATYQYGWWLLDCNAIYSNVLQFTKLSDSLVHNQSIQTTD